MKRLNIEVAVGLFLVVGVLCFAYLSVRIGDLRPFGDDAYTLTARFNSISGLKEGASIEIAGVKIGRVNRIRLDQKEYEAVVEMAIDRGVKLQDDSIASIRTAGVIGDKYVHVSPGGSDEYLEAGGEIFETESAISLEELVSKYIFEKD